MRIFTKEDIELIKQLLGEEKISPYILREIIAAEREFATSPANEIIKTLEAVDKTLSENPLALSSLFSILERKTMESVAEAYASLSEANRKIDKGLNKFTEIYPEFIKEREKQEAEILEIPEDALKAVKDFKDSYQTSLKASVSEKNFRRSAYYCGELLLINLKVGDLVSAYKFATDLMNYASEEFKPSIAKLCDELEFWLKREFSEDDIQRLIKMADIIVHKLRVGFKR